LGSLGRDVEHRDHARLREAQASTRAEPFARQPRAQLVTRAADREAMVTAELVPNEHVERAILLVLRGVPGLKESVTAGDTIAVDPSPHHPEPDAAP
jgi:hypothetical protein